MTQWYKEYKFYKFSKFASPMTAAQCSRQPCGHYTQVFITSSFVSSNFSTHENIYGCFMSENFLIKCRKTKTSVMTMTNHTIGKGQEQSKRTQSEKAQTA